MRTRKSLFALALALVVALGCVVATAFADTTPSGKATLDLEAGDTNPASKDIDQNYTFTQADEEYTDATKVKLEWTISDIAATYKSHKTWDPDQMKWVEAKESVTAADQTATFKVTNYSSKAVLANAKFEVETSLADTFDADNSSFANNDCTVATPVVRDTTTTYQDSDFTALAQTITATLKFNADAFAKLAAQDSAVAYGTYTVAISAAPTVVAKCLTFIANIDNSSVTPAFVSGTFQYSTDNGANWTDGVSGTEISLAKAGDTVMIKGTNCVTNAGNHFAMAGSISAEGDVTSLTNGEGGDANLVEAYPNLEESCGCYQYMFSECSALTNAPALPSTVLCDNCYEGMFCGCANLTVAPTLPAKTMTYNCYANMFGSCTSLKTAPELPAKALAEYCYRSMFYGCSALVSAPVLPATDLEGACYCQMFYGCAWLFETPELPATILPDGCYSSMFTESGIKSITALPEIESYGSDCLSGMFSNCPNLLVQEGGTMPEGGGIIFTYTATATTDVADNMFALGVSPTNGTTYYYQPNNDVYRLEIVLENCQINSYSVNTKRFLTVTSESTVARTTLEKAEGYSVPSSAVVTGGLTTESVKLTNPTNMEKQVKQYLKNCVYLTITVTGITGDATITITAAQQ